MMKGVQFLPDARESNSKNGRQNAPELQEAASVPALFARCRSHSVNVNPYDRSGAGQSKPVKVNQTDAAAQIGGQIVCNYFKMNDLQLYSSQTQSRSVKLGQTTFLCVPFYEGGERKESCFAAPAIVYYAVPSQSYLPNETGLKAAGIRQTALRAAAGAARAVFGRDVHCHRAQPARDAIAPAAATTAIRV